MDQEAALTSVWTRPFYVLKIALVLGQKRPHVCVKQKKDQQISVISYHNSGLCASRSKSSFDDKYISIIDCMICVTSSRFQLVTEKINEALLVFLVVQEPIFLVLH